MRYPASEKLEIIRLVEQSHLGVGSTLDKLGIPKTTFYRWYDRFLAFGDAGLEDRNSSPGRVWNRIPDDVRGQIIDLALEETQLSPRELAVRFTDTRGYFVSEASVYRLLKAHDLITSPAFVVIKAADEFRDKTTAPNQLWQTDFTYLKVIGWGWFYLSTILQPNCRPSVPAGLNQEIQDFALTVHGTPEIELPPSNYDDHLVQVPAFGRSWPPTLNPPRIGPTEFQDPSSNCLIRDVETTLGKQVLNVPIAQRETAIEPDGMLDDDRWKAVTTVGYLAHPETLKHRPCRSHAVNVTMPGRSISASRK